MTIEPIVTPRKPIRSGSINVKQVGDRRVDFCFVEVGNLSKHRIERTGLFTDADHLRHHVRKHFSGFQRLDEAFAAFDTRLEPS